MSVIVDHDLIDPTNPQDESAIAAITLAELPAAPFQPFSLTS